MQIHWITSETTVGPTVYLRVFRASLHPHNGSSGSPAAPSERGWDDALLLGELAAVLPVLHLGCRATRPARQDLDCRSPITRQKICLRRGWFSTIRQRAGNGFPLAKCSSSDFSVYRVPGNTEVLRLRLQIST